MLLRSPLLIILLFYIHLTAHASPLPPYCTSPTLDYKTTKPITSNLNQLLKNHLLRKNLTQIYQTMQLFPELVNHDLKVTGIHTENIYAQLSSPFLSLSPNYGQLNSLIFYCNRNSSFKKFAQHQFDLFWQRDLSAEDTILRQNLFIAQQIQIIKRINWTTRYLKPLQKRYNKLQKQIQYYKKICAQISPTYSRQYCLNGQHYQDYKSHLTEVKKLSSIITTRTLELIPYPLYLNKVETLNTTKLFKQWFQAITTFHLTDLSTEDIQWKLQSDNKLHNTFYRIAVQTITQRIKQLNQTTLNICRENKVYYHSEELLKDFLLTVLQSKHNSSHLVGNLLAIQCSLLDHDLKRSEYIKTLVDNTLYAIDLLGIALSPFTLSASSSTAITVSKFSHWLFLGRKVIKYGHILRGLYVNQRDLKFYTALYQNNLVSAEKFHEIQMRGKDIQKVIAKELARQLFKQVGKSVKSIRTYNTLKRQRYKIKTIIKTINKTFNES